MEDREVVTTERKSLQWEYPAPEKTPEELTSAKLKEMSLTEVEGEINSAQLTLGIKISKKEAVKRQIEKLQEILALQLALQEAGILKQKEYIGKLAQAHKEKTEVKAEVFDSFLRSVTSPEVTRPRN